MVDFPEILGSKILIVDDQKANIQLLEMMLSSAGYLSVFSTMDPTAVCALHRNNQYDLILLDLLMPQMDGFQVMYARKEIEEGIPPSVLVVTAQPGHKLRAMQAGAKDFISKPFDNSEMLTRIHYMLEVRSLNKVTANYAKLLEETVGVRTAELRRSEEMFRELAANIPDALSIQDIEHQRLEYVNQAWHNLNGLSAVPGDPLARGHEAVHPDDLKWLNNERRQVSSGHASNEYRLVRPDQSVRWVRARSFPIANPAGEIPWAVEILEDVTERREAQRQLVHLARHDALTGLPNRTLFYESLKEALDRTVKERLIVSVLLIDIDYFKAINDSLGHTTGDALLREFAARLAKCLRPEDKIGRLGGDEFAVVVSTPTNSFGAQFVADRIQKALRTPFVLEDREVLVTVSIGIASCPANSDDFESLIRCADVAMYDAKASGRNTFRSYSAELNERASKKLDIESALRLAHERGEFVLHYQPKMQIESGKLTSVEALIRWNRPGHGLVMPANFVPALEEMGLIVPVGVWVVEAACRQIQQWEKAALGKIRIAINVSSRQVREDLFISHVADAVRKYRIDPTQLEFEITESTFMEHGESTEAALRKLKDMGIAISIDDFGTGYSNLAYLQRFQVDALKIDIAFIRDVTSNQDAATIAIAIINMAHNLRLKVVAEGVETIEQLEFLRLHGCDEVQGYFFSKPLPAEELSVRFRQTAAHDLEQRMTAQDEQRCAVHA